MSLYPQTRRALDARMPGPVFRDVHPDREPVALYDPDGSVALESDLPRRMMRLCRKVAKQNGVSPAEFLVTAFVDHFDRHSRGF